MLTTIVIVIDKRRIIKDKTKFAFLFIIIVYTKIKNNLAIITCYESPF